MQRFIFLLPDIMVEGDVGSKAFFGIVWILAVHQEIARQLTDDVVTSKNRPRRGISHTLHGHLTEFPSGSHNDSPPIPRPQLLFHSLPPEAIIPGQTRQAYTLPGEPQGLLLSARGVRGKLFNELSVIPPRLALSMCFRTYVPNFSYLSASSVTPFLLFKEARFRTGRRRPARRPDRTRCCPGLGTSPGHTY